MAGPQKKKKREETKSTEETMISAAVNSQYNTCTPLWKAQNIRICDPVTRLDKTFPVNSPAFYEYFSILCSKGMKERLFKELDWFRKEIDTAWNEVYEKLLSHVESNSSVDAK